MFDSVTESTASPGEIRTHCEMIHRLAGGLGANGKLVIACFGEDPENLNPKTGMPGCPLPPVVVHVEIGDIETMVAAIADLIVRKHGNVYMPLAVFRLDLPRGRKGFEEDIIAVMGLVADFDDCNAARWAERLPLPPNYVLETSAGRFQAFFLFDKPEPAHVVKAVAKQLKDFAGCDHGTSDLSHVWRIAGSLNSPNAKKVADGRSREPQLVRVIKPWDETTTSLEALVAALAARYVPRLVTKDPANGAEPGKDHTSPDAARVEHDGVGHDGETAGSSYPGISVETIVNVLPPKVRDRITAAASRDRSRDLYYVVSAMVVRNLDNPTIERIIRHYPQGIGAKYINRNDLDREISRVREKISRRKAAQTDADKAQPSGRPILKVWDGALPSIVDAAEKLLIERDHDIYEFGDQVVRPAIEPIRIAGDRTVPSLRLIPIGINHLIERFTLVIDFRRFDARSHEFVSIDCPKKLAATYLERIGLWRLPKLVAITTCPLLRSDGTVLEKPGFDLGTGILFDSRGVTYPPIPAVPTRNDAIAALAELKLLISEFPFVDEPSRSVALSAMLTSVSRLALSTAPMHAFDAPEAGTGKSKLVDCCALIATGHECPVISQGKDETEMEKRLGSALIAGDRMISIDNCEHPLGSQFLCQALTQRLVKVRVLGESKNVTVPNAAVYFGTGNNLTLAGDMPRRAIVGRLDAQTERPELREFMTEDPVDALKRERQKYVALCLTILRAYICAGAPAQTQPLGSFEAWSRLVRDTLIWLGEADPVATMERSRLESPQREALAALLVQWNTVLGMQRVSVKQVICKATDFDLSSGQKDLIRRRFLYPEFREALLAVAGDGVSISGKRLGKWLSANKGKVFNGLRIIPDGVLEGVARYRLQRPLG
jgi:hypothetical protein